MMVSEIVLLTGLLRSAMTTSRAVCRLAGMALASVIANSSSQITSLLIGPIDLDILGSCALPTSRLHHSRPHTFPIQRIPFRIDDMEPRWCEGGEFIRRSSG